MLIIVGKGQQEAGRRQEQEAGRAYISYTQEAEQGLQPSNPAPQ